MKLLFLSIISVFIFAGCQTAPKVEQRERYNREIATRKLIFVDFVESLAKKTKMSVTDIDDSIIKYLKTTESNSNFGNHAASGMSEKQVESLDSLLKNVDDQPHIAKVQDWVMENMSRINPKLYPKDVVRSSYNEVMKTAHKTAYKAHSTVVDSAGLAKKYNVSSIPAISENQYQIVEFIDTLIKPYGRKIASRYKKVLQEFGKKGHTSPEALANGQSIVLSAARITERTGLPAMGEGCEALVKTMSKQVLANKADVDAETFRILVGKTQSKFSPKDIDNARVQAFEAKLGHTPDEARAALSRLKKEPCKMY